MIVTLLCFSWFCCIDVSIKDLCNISAMTIYNLKGFGSVYLNVFLMIFGPGACFTSVKCFQWLLDFKPYFTSITCVKWNLGGKNDHFILGVLSIYCTLKCTMYLLCSDL